MNSTDLDADPENEPYRVLGIDPIKGKNSYKPKEDIVEHAKELMKDHKSNKNHFTKINKALKEVKTIHPSKSSTGSWRVPLNIEAENIIVKYQTDIKITVTDFLDNPIPEATLRLHDPDGQRLGRTDKNGSDSFTIGKGPGDYTIVATKNANGNKTFINDTIEVTVEKLQKQLKFDQVPTSCTAGDLIDVKVSTENGNTIAGVLVQPETGSAAETDNNGLAKPTINGNGTCNLKADKKDNKFNKYISTDASVSVKKKRIQLKFDKAPDRTKVGKRINFKITDKKGNPIENAEIDFGGNTYKTSKKGQASTKVPPTISGDVNVVVTKQDTAGITYKKNHTTIYIEERTVELFFNDPPNEATIGNTVKFQIVDEDADPVEGVKISGGSSKDTTDKQGYGNLTFTAKDVGVVQIIANKQGQSGINYNAANDSISVNKKELQLNLHIDRDSIVVGKKLELTVTDGSQPIEEVLVKHKSVSKKTNKNGELSLEFDSHGKKTIVASKENTPEKVFKSDQTKVIVDREVRHLNLTSLDKKIESGKPSTFEVKDNNNRTVERAKVEATDADTVKTDSSGQAELTFRSAGEKQVTVSKPPTNRSKFIQKSIPISVREPPKSVTITSVPNSVTVGDSVVINVIDHHDNPIPNAVIKKVSNQESQVYTSDKSGQVELTFSSPGYYTISATKDGFDIFDKTPIEVES